MYDFSSLLHNTQLSELQNNAVASLVQSRSKIVALSPGCGKTLVSLTAAEALIRKNNKAVCVIFSPKSARAAFKKELSTKLGVPYALLCSEESVPYKGQNFIVIEQSVLSKNMDLVYRIAQTRPIISVVDEAHVLQNPGNNVSTCLNQLKPTFSAEWLLSGSPLLNSIEGLYHFCKHADPSGLPNWWEFRSRYCETKKREVRMRGRSRTITEIIGYKNLNELQDYLNQIMIIGSIPYNIKYLRVRVDLDDELKEAYNRASKGVLDSSYCGEKEFGGRLHDLQRVVDGSHHDLLKRSLSSKEKALLMRVRQIMDRGESVLVYCEYEETIDRLGQVLKSYSSWAHINRIHYLVGATPERDRALIEQTLGQKEVVLVSQAARQSRNLQRANHIIAYNVPFSVGTVCQLIGRICRMDSTYSTQYFHMIETRNTIDEYKVSLFYDNISLINRLFGNMGVLPTETILIDRENLTKLKRRLLWNKRK